MKPRLARSGFSLIEALVVLAIGGMALAIIFSIGVKAGDAGFKLGRRAMSVADVDLATSDLRSLVRSLALRPAATYNPRVDRPIEGTANRLEADIVAERATQCAPLGWAGRLVLRIEVVGGERRLMCEAGEQSTILLTTTDQRAGLSYSTDGSVWSPTYRSATERAVGGGDLRSEKLFVRFRGGAIDVMDGAGSGRPESWIRFDDPV